jgi:DNA-directed RNA polymerase specialized sigma24 family protein
VINKPTFEEKLPVIEDLLAKRRSKWTLHCASMDWDDVAQIIRVHLHTKWSLWDHNKPLENWVSSIISNQISNLLRNNYLTVAPPCSKCPQNQGAGLCGFTASGEQCAECPLYKRWKKHKEAGYNIKLARSIDDETNTESFKVSSSPDFNWEDQIASLHSAMKARLPEDLYTIYESLYINHKDETELAAELGFKTKESGRIPGYKQIYNFKKKILEVAKEVLSER